MNKRILVFFAIILMLRLPTANATIPKNFDFSQTPIEKETKKYENKEYNSTGEYLQAFYDGKCSSVWVWIHLDYEGKRNIIKALKGMFYEGAHVRIRKPASFYVEAIDYVIANTVGAENYRVKALFQTIAVMECDFDEGIDKEMTAKKWMGRFYPAFVVYQKFQESSVKK